MRQYGDVENFHILNESLGAAPPIAAVIPLLPSQPIKVVCCRIQYLFNHDRRKDRKKRGGRDHTPRKLVESHARQMLTRN